MKISIFLFVLIFLAYYLGSHFGISLYYYYERGDFQSSLRGLISSPIEEILSGVFSSLFTVMVIMTFYKITKKRIVCHYIISIVIIYFIQFVAWWEQAANFQISRLTSALSYVFVNIEFVTFCIVSYIVLKSLGTLGGR